jgi:peptidyl-prolyl cis-trans isomerase-like 3
MSVTLETSVGDIKLELFCEHCPKTAENFLALAASGFYNNTTFHRVIRGFLAQGGDPAGGGKTVHSIYGGPFEDEFVDNLKHEKRGMLSMANDGPNKNGCQFFITFSKQPSLDKKYTCFGRVIDGWESLDLLERQPVDSHDKPLNEVKLYRCKIHANPIADQAYLKG